MCSVNTLVEGRKVHVTNQLNWKTFPHPTANHQLCRREAEEEKQSRSWYISMIRTSIEWLDIHYFFLVTCTASVRGGRVTGKAHRWTVCHLTQPNISETLERATTHSRDHPVSPYRIKVFLLSCPLGCIHFSMFCVADQRNCLSATYVKVLTFIKKEKNKPIM